MKGFKSINFNKTTKMKFGERKTATINTDKIDKSLDDRKPINNSNSLTDSDIVHPNYTGNSKYHASYRGEQPKSFNTLGEAKQYLTERGEKGNISYEDSTGKWKKTEIHNINNVYPETKPLNPDGKYNSERKYDVYSRDLKIDEITVKSNNPNIKKSDVRNKLNEKGYTFKSNDVKIKKHTPEEIRKPNEKGEFVSGTKWEEIKSDKFKKGDKVDWYSPDDGETYTFEVGQIIKYDNNIDVFPVNERVNGRKTNLGRIPINEITKREENNNEKAERPSFDKQPVGYRQNETARNKSNVGVIQDFLVGSKSKSGSMISKDDTLYSYDTPIAKKTGYREIEITNKKYSPTTSKQITFLKRDAEKNGYTIKEMKNTNDYRENDNRYSGNPTNEQLIKQDKTNIGTDFSKNKMSVSEMRAGNNRAGQYFFSKNTLRMYKGEKKKALFDKKTGKNYIKVEKPQSMGGNAYYEYNMSNGHLNWVNKNENSFLSNK